MANPQTLNRYQYCLDNPLRHIDRNGRYEEDVHRDLTYVLALAAGFNTFSAKAISNADQGMDDNPKTNPDDYSISDESVQKRALYHFTTSARRTQMWRTFSDSGSLQDLGAFEHAEQDSFSHAGFGPTWGHFFSGHDPDKTYVDPGTADQMARATFSTLTRALGVLRYKGAETITYKAVDWKTISPMVGAFNRAKTREEKLKIINQIGAEVQRQHYEQEKKREEEKLRRESKHPRL